MPEEEKKTVDIDTSGPETEINVPEEKDEAVVDTAPETTEQETETETKVETEKKSDEELEDYSKGVQSRIAKLTRKMREAERREAAAIEYATVVENKRKQDQERFNKVDSDYTAKFEESVKSGMDMAQQQLATAIEAGDAQAQVAANKKIAELAFENAKLQQRKEATPVQQETPVKLSDGGQLPNQTPQQMPQADPMAEDWAAKNRWFGTDRAMTFTAFEIHKDLVDKEGYDPKSNEYYH